MPFEAQVEVNLADLFDEETGFTTMQRCTGFDGAIVTALMARGETSTGAIPREISVDCQRYVEELKRRGFEIEILERFMD